MKFDKLSIIIPIHRPESMVATMDSMVGQTNDNFEVICFENGYLSENAAEEIGRYSDVLNTRYFYDPRGGVNRARDKGAQLATHDVVALIDQDVVLTSSWVEAIIEAHNTFPTAGVIGGKVVLDYVDGDPGWCIGDFSRKLSAVDYGDNVEVLTDWRYVVGGNLSFRKTFHQKVGGFGEHVDSAFFFNNELTFHESARKFGTPGIVYYPNMTVRHLIPKSRTTLEYFLDRFYKQGIHDIAFQKYKRNNWDTLDLLGFFEQEMYRQEDFEEMKRDKDSLTAPLDEIFSKNYLACRMAYLSGLHAAIHEVDGFDKIANMFAISQS